MKIVLGYLVVVLTALTVVITFKTLSLCPPWVAELEPAIDCILVAGVGGVLYCLRAVYMNYSVLRRWDDNWRPWYFVRPIASMAAGGIAYVFLKAGLLLLQSTQAPASSPFGFLALGFLAGYNVNRFLELLENVGKSVFGIDRSRATQQPTNILPPARDLAGVDKVGAIEDEPTSVTSAKLRR